MPNKSKPQLPKPSCTFENIVTVEEPASARTLRPVAAPSRRRRFIGGVAASTAAIIGGCSRDPISGAALADLMRRLEGAGSDVLARVSDEIEQFNDLQMQPAPGRKPHPKQPRRPVILPGETEYATFLAGLNLTHISPHEVIRPHRNVRLGVANTLPPKTLWSQMTPTLRVADALRNRLGVRLNYINSAYRSPDYNAACPGAASRSFHMKNCALDLMFDCRSESAFAMAKKLRSEGVFKGGIGLYDAFIHIDTRGYHSTWGEA